MFDFLDDWFRQRDYRGCAFINSFGELGTVSPRVAELALEHKEGFRQALTQLSTAAGAPDPERLADHLILLSEGAITRTLDRFFCDPIKLGQVARQSDA